MFSALEEKKNSGQKLLSQLGELAVSSEKIFYTDFKTLPSKQMSVSNNSEIFYLDYNLKL